MGQYTVNGELWTIIGGLTAAVIFLWGRVTNCERRWAELESAAPKKKGRQAEKERFEATCEKIIKGSSGLPSEQSRDTGFRRPVIRSPPLSRPRWQSSRMPSPVARPGRRNLWLSRRKALCWDGSLELGCRDNFCLFFVRFAGLFFEVCRERIEEIQQTDFSRHHDRRDTDCGERSARCRGGRQNPRLGLLDVRRDQCSRCCAHSARGKNPRPIAGALTPSFLPNFCHLEVRQ